MIRPIPIETCKSKISSKNKDERQDAQNSQILANSRQTGLIILTQVCGRSWYIRLRWQRFRFEAGTYISSCLTSHRQKWVATKSANSSTRKFLSMRSKTVNVLLDFRATCTNFDRLTVKRYILTLRGRNSNPLIFKSEELSFYAQIVRYCNCERRY